MPANAEDLEIEDPKTQEEVDEEEIFNSFVEERENKPASKDPEEKTEDKEKADGEEETDSKKPEGKDPEESGETPKDKEKPEEKKPEEVEEDVWKDVNPVILQEFDRLRNDAATWEHRYKSDAGRINKLQNEIKELKDSQTENLSPEEFQKAFTSKDNWLEFAELNPGVAQVLEEFMSGMAQATGQNINKIQENQNQLLESSAQTANIEADNLITLAYPEWKSWINEPDFMEWVNTLPAETQSIISAGSVEDSLTLMGLYETHLKAIGKHNLPPADDEAKRLEEEEAAKLQEKRNKQLEGGTTTPSTGSGTATPISETDEEALFNFFADKKIKAKA